MPWADLPSTQSWPILPKAVRISGSPGRRPTRVYLQDGAFDPGATPVQKRVLVVEDNLAQRSVARFSLQHAGFDVVVESNGRGGWLALEQQPIDIVVSDQLMPEMTGFELFRLMRQDPRFAELPLILLTAQGLDCELLCRELRVGKLIHKPFSPRELVAAVKDCLKPLELLQPN